MRRTLALIASSLLLAASATAACGETAATPSPSAAPAPAITKVVVFMVENHSLSEMRSGMPRTYRFASRFGIATHYRAITHPSLPNYLAIAAGSTKGVTDDANPSSHQLTGPDDLQSGAGERQDREDLRRRDAVAVLRLERR